MFVVRIPPEHVRLQIAAGEIEEQQPVVVIFDRIFQQRQPFFQNEAGLSQKVFVSKDAVRTGFVVFLKARSVEQALVLWRHLE